ncbi:MAG: hypothetical protein ABEK01_05450 [Candidatus Nanohaloarchaea archaeon]
MFFWGLTVTLGYALSDVIAAAMPVARAETSIVLTWVVLMAIPVALTVRKVRKGTGLLEVNPVWAGLTVLGLLGNVAGIAFGLAYSTRSFGYFEKWFLFGAAGFAYTAWKMDGFSRYVYTAAAAGNVVFAVLLFSDPSLVGAAFLGGVVLQGMPMMVDWFYYSHCGEVLRSDLLP